MTTHRTHDPLAQPAARSAAGFIESEAIAHRAYELFQGRLDNWLRAEQELEQSNDDGASE